MSSTKRSTVGSVLALLLSAAIIAAATWLFFNRQYAIDWLNVASFKPSSEIATIETRTGMTDKGRFVFYATKPEALEASTFNSQCPRQEVGNPILGCYTSGDRIFIYNLTNTQLDGMKEVTAAHEMLHAVWQHTSDADKKRIGALLQAAYDKLNNPELKTRMGYYQRTEPGEFINELHSILGTEVANLSPDLENYYNQYFNRTTVLQLHSLYDGFYTGLTTQATDLYAKMQTLSASIDTKSKAYDADVAQLSADITSFNARANSGSFSSQSQFQAERARLVARSNQLAKDRDAINADIATYNGYYQQYQKIGEQIQLLNNSIDSYKALDKAPSV